MVAHMAAASTIALQSGPRAAPTEARDARLRLLLAGGGDERLWLDPATRRNRYGVPASPAPDELWFSSSTACAISTQGWSAARDTLDRLTGEGQPCAIVSWFDTLRTRLRALYAGPGDEVVLAGSGTEAELVTLFIGLALARGPIVNIVVAPAETGSGVPHAAAGRHFLGHASLGGRVAQGSRLADWADIDLETDAIEIRAPNGRLRAQADIDQEAALKVERRISQGAFVILHVLDASKTGRTGVSRAAARAIAARHGPRVLVTVDACQLRCPRRAIHDDVDAGFLVMLTGSKFAGGPAFCGAVILPQALAERLSINHLDARALADYSAALDWPPALRPRIGPALGHPANLGLGLRWTAALAEIDAFEALPPAERDALMAHFEQAVRERVAVDRGLVLIDERKPAGAAGLVPIAHADGSDPRSVYEAMAQGHGGGRPCHLGQPVAVGERLALRVCASMPMITEAAKSGVLTLEADLDEVFAAWAKLRA
jgi:hypothetical protein